MFDILLYNDLQTASVKKQFEKLLVQLAKGDFTSAEVKKLHVSNLFRAKLDYENRVLFSFGRYNNKTCILILEIILNHEYEKSRFLRGSVIDESKLTALSGAQQIDEKETIVMPYINEKHRHFHLLDKVISFDDAQSAILDNALPQIIIGSAGSGKTALTLEKLKTLSGQVLYITLSSFLAENSARLFYSNHFEKEGLEVDFLSFQEFLETYKVPEGKELGFNAFEAWFVRYRQASKIKDAHQLFEEFRGVLTGMDTDKEFLSRQDYLALGIKQSIFLGDERAAVYDMFEKYQSFLKESKFYDLNQIAFQWLQLISARYDFVVIDEVQDLTNIQLLLILKSLITPNNFILCGDSNQVVHPNFFSWSNIKTLFYKHETKGNEISVLHSNYRNSQVVSQLANQLLKIKNARFGSIDRESNYLVNTISQHSGEAKMIESKDSVLTELNKKTSRSTRYAVVVMRNEDKVEAQRIFKTPLLFSVQESKGLEYDNVILYHIIANNAKEFNSITEGVTAQDLLIDELQYARAKDKADKSLDVYKFFINSLYVSITRAVKNVLLVEPNAKHRLLDLLELVHSEKNNTFAEDVSSLEDWKREAIRLEKQGKAEQANAIRKNILQLQTPSWEVINSEVLATLRHDALLPETFNKKSKDRLFEFALIYNQMYDIELLIEHDYNRAKQAKTEYSSLFRKYYHHYREEQIKPIVDSINKYGINFRDPFNLTPLHVAAYCGSKKVSTLLLENGADPNAWDSLSRSPLHIALEQAYQHEEYRKKRLAQVFDLLTPESLKIKINQRMIKIDKHQGEFFLLHFIFATQAVHVQQNLLDRKYDKFGFTAPDLTSFFSDLPESLLRDNRKKRSYISSLLSRHEINGEDRYSKQLFERVKHGVYSFNTTMEVFHGDDWVKVSDIFNAQVGDKNAITNFVLQRDKKRLDEERRKKQEQLQKEQDRYLKEMAQYRNRFNK